MNKKLLLSASLVITLLVITGCGQKINPETTDQPSVDQPNNDSEVTKVGEMEFNYSLDYAEGENCTGISDCQAVTYGCGKTICTNQPENYTEDMITDCMADINHPKDNGYRCGCVPNEYKCGWLK